MKKTLPYLALLCFALVGCSQPTTTALQDALPHQEMQDSSSLAVESAHQDSIRSGYMVSAPADTATLKAKFVVDGDVPTPAAIDGSRDPFCAPLTLKSELMVVGDGGELQNLVLYVDARRTDADLPEIEVDKDAKIVLDNKGCVFVPHVFAARPGQTVTVKNSDATGHNANFSFFNNPPQNFLVPAMAEKPLTLGTDEPAPIPVECNVHPWMKSYIIVTEHPFVGISDENGEMVIENLPVGSVTFKVWHENSDGSIDEAQVGGKKESWRRGRVEIDLKPGMNDLGTIKLDAGQFKK